MSEDRPASPVAAPSAEDETAQAAQGRSTRGPNAKEEENKAKEYTKRIGQMRDTLDKSAKDLNALRERSDFDSKAVDAAKNQIGAVVDEAKTLTQLLESDASSQSVITAVKALLATAKELKDSVEDDFE